MLGNKIFEINILVLCFAAGESKTVLKIVKSNVKLWETVLIQETHSYK